MDIKLAVSRSGHDKDSIYVIIKEEADMVYLVDGILRPIEKPKRKNKKHIQVIKKLPKEITEVFKQENFRNEEIKRAIKLYQKAIL
ncbi:MAG: KOW domain-containing RNA-binding protein [Lachnospiraceae bacterium]